MVPQIDFAYAFAHASFLDNLTVYITLIVITVIYVLVCLISHWFDKRDKKKLSIELMEDNLPTDKYFYEIIVFTGTRKESGTKSKVKFIIIRIRVTVKACSTLRGYIKGNFFNRKKFNF